MRLFYFEREKDISGVSGTGRVLEGIEFTDGTVAIRWLSERSSTAIYKNIQEFEEIHSHGGLGHIVWTSTDVIWTKESANERSDPT